MSQDLSPSSPFIWDASNIDHIARHNVTPEEVEEAFENGIFKLESRFREGELRTAYLGETDLGRVLTIVVTLRSKFLRVVTAHSADRTDRKVFTYLKEQQNAKVD